MRAIAFAILALLFGLAILSQRHRGLDAKDNRVTAVAFALFLVATLICIIGGW